MRQYLKYLLSPTTHLEKHVFENGLYNGFKVIVCRLKGHPNGPIYYTTSGFEPDMRCKDCYDEL